MTLTDFLLARIADDQADAETAHSSEWAPNVPLRGHVASMTGTEVAACSDHATRHIARNNPARVLAECEAKRAIVGHHQPVTDGTHYASLTGEACGVCTRFHADTDCEGEDWPCVTLRHLAAPYADHPDYDERWRP